MLLRQKAVRRREKKKKKESARPRLFRPAHAVARTPKHTSPPRWRVPRHILCAFVAQPNDAAARNTTPAHFLPIDRHVTPPLRRDGDM